MVTVSFLLFLIPCMKIQTSKQNTETSKKKKKKKKHENGKQMNIRTHTQLLLLIIFVEHFSRYIYSSKTPWNLQNLWKPIEILPCMRVIASALLLTMVATLLTASLWSGFKLYFSIICSANSPCNGRLIQRTTSRSSTACTLCQTFL